MKKHYNLGPDPKLKHHRAQMGETTLYKKIIITGSEVESISPLATLSNPPPS